MVFILSPRSQVRGHTSLLVIFHKRFKCIALVSLKFMHFLQNRRLCRNHLFPFSVTNSIPQNLIAAPLFLVVRHATIGPADFLIVLYLGRV